MLPNKKSNMLTRIRESLNKLLSKILSESLAKIVSDGIIVIVSPSVLLLAFWGYVLDLSRVVLTILTLQLPIYILALSLIILYLIYLAIKKLTNTGPRFIEYGKLKWLIISKDGKLDEIPYCSEHQAQLVFDHYGDHYCPVDGKREYDGLKFDTIEVLHEAAESISIASANSTLKNTNLSDFKK